MIIKHLNMNKNYGQNTSKTDLYEYKIHVFETYICRPNTFHCKQDSCTQKYHTGG